MTPSRPPRRQPALRAAALAVAAVVATASTAACSSSSAGSAHLERVTVVLDWTPNTNHSGLYLARAKGWYRQAGLDVRIVEPGESSSLQLLAAGTADVAVSVQEDLIPARAQGLPVVSLAAIIQHNTSSLVSLRSAGIKRPGDLAGRTYGGFGGALEKALVRKLASCGGANPDLVRFVDVGNSDYRAGLLRHQFDVTWIFDGWDGLRLGAIDKLPLSSIRFADQTACIPDWYTPLLASSTQMITHRPAVLRRFMAATTRGYQEAMRHPDQAVRALMAASPELDRNLVTRSAAYLATRYAASPAAWGRQDRIVWSRFDDFLHGAGLIPAPIDVDKAFTNRFLPGPR